MAQLYLRRVGGVTLGCYSERGLMSFIMFRVLPQQLPQFLADLQFSNGFQNPFREDGELTDIVIFSELDFGDFGSPDGAIFFRRSGLPFFLFIEAKLNQSYQQACQGNPRNYASTIKGQLELKWRAITLFAGGAIHWENNGPHLVENDALIAFYQHNDPIYKNVQDPAAVPVKDRRQLQLIAGVGDVFKYIAQCTANGMDNVYYLAVTQEKDNPLNNPGQNPLPQCCNIKGDDVTAYALQKFCWISTGYLEGLG